MKNFVKILIFSLFAISSNAQLAIEIDSKSVKLPRYADLAAIQAAIPTAQQGMMVYNVGTASNWYYNGTAWTNILGNVIAPLNLIYSTTPAVSIGLDQTISGERIVGGDPFNPTLSAAYGVKGSVSGVGYQGAGVYGIGSSQNYGVSGYSQYRSGVYGSSENNIGVEGISSSGVGGYFVAGNGLTVPPNDAALVAFSSLNSYKAVYGLMKGLGRGGVFEIDNVGSSNPALEGITNGAGNGVRGISYNGVAGLFSSSNYYVLGGNSSLIGHSSKDGFKSIYGISEGSNGQAGVFEIQNSSNSNAALESSTNGTGKAAYFHGINALETNGSIKFGGAGVGTIAAGKVLTSDAVGNATWQGIPAVTGPLTLTSTTTTMSSTATGTVGNASNFSISNVSNPSNGISVSTSGTGKAIFATNNSSINPTINVVNNTNLGNALDISGGIKVSGTNKAAFKIVSTGGPLTNIFLNQLIIPNTSLANHIDDIVMITHNYGGSSTNNFVKPCGVYWEPGTSTWRIYVEDGTAMPLGITFNVLVIKQ
ncbi:hypothetical protein [Lacihabitans sp. CS3-21]|uniref:DUF7452 domain-containing protein n=1 Tax=Lacihabitans sp. CS3-21 TaxID=2487332 RepID=UPI0020CC938E|nr:hypothetical protein [Lacihabitans sp. CS3-21]MCP9746910.1 hypothetical protein [Lacihabitans sp. CS3-21]